LKPHSNDIEKTVTIPSNWYEDFFHGVTLDLWRKAIPPEQTKAEADFLEQALNCEKGSHLLDVPCGNGRLSFELGQRGYCVTGVDISEEFIQEARVSATTLVNPPANAGGTDFMTQINFILGDMRRIEGQAIYDGAYCFGNSFGFLEFADMERFLSGVARALKPGARFVIETAMAAESLIPKFEVETSHQIGDIHMIIKERYVANEGCVDSEYIFDRNGTTETRTARHWIYTAAEIQRMLGRAGFKVLEVLGSLKAQPFALGSDELFVIAKRVSEAA
jgi:SAM-dependent methyltransferase